jgi:Flp pilus assembly protein TadG
MTIRAGSERGQATVELTALLPLLAIVALCAYAVLAARTADEQAGAAAAAAAIALVQDRDPRTAARDALPQPVRRRSTVAIADRRVTVTVRPRVPLLARRLEAQATADAGPEPTP